MFDKYKVYFIVLGVVLLELVTVYAGYRFGVTRVTLEKTQGELSETKAFLVDYQSVVKRNDELSKELATKQNEIDKLLLEDKNDLMEKTRGILDLLNNAPGVYADSLCGEAGSYPPVFVTRFTDGSGGTTSDISGKDASSSSR